MPEASKFGSIYIPYAISVLLVFVVVKLAGLDGRSTSYSDLLLNLLCINGFISVPYVEGAHWYMTYLLVTYFYICVIKKLRLQNTGWVFSIIVVITILLKTIGIFTPEIFKYILSVLSGGSAIVSFLIGVQIFKVLHSQSTYERMINLAFAMCGLLWSWKIMGSIAAAMFAIMIVLFIAAVLEKCSWLSCSFLVSLGSISYPLYLTHQNIGFVVINKLMSYTSFFVAVLAAFVCAVIVAITVKALSGYIKNVFVNLLSRTEM